MPVSASEATIWPSRASKWLLLAITSLVIVLGIANWLMTETHAVLSDSAEPHGSDIVKIVDVAQESVDVAASAVKAMGIHLQQARDTTSTRPLSLSGQLVLDPDRLVHVPSRFIGEVISVGLVKQLEGTDEPRALRVGDRIEKGQVLATVWSKEVGEKKSDLVDALSSLWLHESLLAKLRKAGEGTVAQRLIDEMQRNYESGLISVSRLKRTLHSWRIPDDELVDIEAEARRIHQAAAPTGISVTLVDSPSGKNRDQSWAEIDIRAPINGVILEKNFTVGDVVDGATDLFKLADVKRLGVLAHIYEDDLPQLLAMPPHSRRWTVFLPGQTSSEPIEGAIETVGQVIDPNQHTAIVLGWIENTNQQLRVGQFARATILLPVSVAGVSLPVSALVETEAGNCILLAMPGEYPEQWQRIRRIWVNVVRRTSTAVWVVPKSAKDELRPGDEVVDSAAIELQAKVNELLLAAAHQAKNTSPALRKVSTP